MTSLYNKYKWRRIWFWSLMNTGKRNLEEDWMCGRSSLSGVTYLTAILSSIHVPRCLGHFPGEQYFLVISKILAVQMSLSVKELYILRDVAREGGLELIGWNYW